MKLPNIVIWVVAIVAYLCVTMAAWVIWPPMGEVLLWLLVVPVLVPEAWFVISDLRKRRWEREQGQ